MEAPFDSSTWDGITGAIYTGAASAEWTWIVLCLLCLAAAIIGGWRHEKEAYAAVEAGKL